MKKIGNILDKKRFSPKVIDQESVFYVFKDVIREEYGKRGVQNISPVFFRDRKIFVKMDNSLWESEILLQKKHIVKKINQQLGGEEIKDLAMSLQ